MLEKFKLSIARVIAITCLAAVFTLPTFASSNWDDYDSKNSEDYSATIQLNANKRFHGQIKGYGDFDYMQGFTLQFQWWTSMGEPIELYAFGWKSRDNKYPYGDKNQPTFLKRADLLAHKDLLHRFDVIKPTKINLRLEGTARRKEGNSGYESEHFFYDIPDSKLLYGGSGQLVSDPVPGSPQTWNDFIHYHYSANSLSRQKADPKEFDALSATQKKARLTSLKNKFINTNQLIGVKVSITEIQWPKSEIAAIAKALQERKDKQNKTNKKDDDFWSGEDDTAKTDSQKDDDFWSGGSDAQVSNSSSKKDDFWDGADSKNDKSKDGYWSGEDGALDKDDFAITKKDGKQGVVAKNGKVLIPFRDWQIVSYRDGLAEVEFDSKWEQGEKCEYWGDDEYWSYTVFIRKKAMVSKTGEYLTTPTMQVSGRAGNHTGFYLTVTNDNCDQACKQRSANNKAEKSQQCKNRVMNDMEKVIQDYVRQGYKRQ